MPVSEKHFERVEGCSKGQPLVFVTPSVIDKLGMPSVDFDSLDEFFAKDLLIPSGFEVEIRLGENYANLGNFNRRNPHIITVDAASSEEELRDEGRTMLVVAHEGRHMSDWIHHKNRMRLTQVGILAGGLAVTFAAHKGLETQGDTAQSVFGPWPFRTTLSVVLGSGACTGLETIYYNSGEKRALLQEIAPATSAHIEDIIFPNPVG